MQVTIVAGARPNFMKVAPIIHQLQLARKSGKNVSFRLVHTGQHYDKKLSQTFFDELRIPEPDANLEAGSGSQATQTAAIMVRFEEELLKNPTDVVLVVGDINSTMACSIVAKKLCVQLVHVEAGIRSFDLSMPEEINRMVTDSIADHFFTTSQYANDNLLKTGIEDERIHFVGNTMIDTLLANLAKLKRPAIADELKLKGKDYFVLTLHRPSNVDDPDRLKKILSQINVSSNGRPIVFPVHPRTAAILREQHLNLPHFHFTDSFGYLEFMHLIKNALAVITDSGGVQEETTVLGVPCLTLRRNSERPETITVGTNELIHELTDLPQWLTKLFENKWKKGGVPEFLGRQGSRAYCGNAY